MGEHKYIVCCDFDGVIHSYETGWVGDACIIPDPPVPRALAWLEHMYDVRRDHMESDGRNELQVCIYSSRSKSPGAVAAMQAWFLGWELREDVLEWLQFPTQKPAASMTIDDRAFCFEGEFPSPEWLIRFLPWNRRAYKERSP